MSGENKAILPKKGLSIKHKLYLSLLVINILALSIGFTAWSAFRTSGQTIRLITQGMIPITEAVSEVIVLSARLSTLTPRLIFVQTEEELENTYRELTYLLNKNTEIIQNIKSQEAVHEHADEHADYAALIPEVENLSIKMAERLHAFKEEISILIDLNRLQTANTKTLSEAHNEFIIGTSPVSDDAQFDLIIGLEGENTEKAQLSASAETLALALEIKGEGNLLAGIIETAIHFEELEGITPLQERFEATLERLKTHLENINQDRSEFELINKSVAAMEELGRGENNVFFLQRERLRKKASLQTDIKAIENISRTISTTVNKLAAHTKKDVEATELQTETTLQKGSYTIISVSLLCLLFTFLLSWFYIRTRVIGRIDYLKSIMLKLTEKQYDVTIKHKEDHDEIGQMASALATFKEKLIENDVLTKDLKKTTDKAEEAKNQMSAILNATGDGIYALDTNGHTTIANPAAERMLGYQFKEMKKKSQHDLIHHSYPGGSPYPVEKCNIYKSITEGKTSYVEDEVFWRKDGTSFPVSYHSTPIIGEAGDVKGAVVSFQDITERKEKERALRHAKREAEHASQAKSEFLANMSHELRTPLNSIIGMSQMLTEDMPQGEEWEMVKTVNKSAVSLLDIVNDILDLSKIEAKQMVLENIGFDFKETLASIVETMAPIASKKGIWLNYRYEKEDIPYIKGDPVRLGRVLTNLIGNALKYTLEGGVELIVGFKNIDDERIKLQCSIIDTGIGIPEDKLKTIFKKFTQADETTTRKFGGTGLGLAITKELVEMMEGEIGVESEEGKGSKFWFEIPFDTADELHEEARENREDASHEHEDNTYDKIDVSEAKILIAEDHELNQVFIKKLLKKMGFENYDLVDNGEKAVKKHQEKQYNLILMDCHMPEMNGYQATQKIRTLEEKAKDSAHIPIIALTADAMVGTREKCIDSGMSDYVSKPIDAGMLKKVLSKWIIFPDSGQQNGQKPQPQDSSEQILDLSLIKEYADTEEELHNFCDVFFSQTEGSLEQLKEQCTSGENKQWSEIAHKIKGGAGMIGAARLHKLAAQAQEMQDATQKQRKEHLAQIQEAYSIVKTILLRDIKGVPTGPEG